MQSDVPSEHDLLDAKRALVARWLVPGARRARRARRLADSIAAAGRAVHAIGIGRKEVAGASTSVACVRFHVARKLPRALISASHRIPTAIAGIPTDVVESPPASLRAARRAEATAPARPRAASCTAGRRRLRRPLVAGVSVAHHAVTAGTISAFVRSTRAGDDREAVHLLSNNHVLADVDRGAPEDDVYQPGPYDGGTAADHVADLTRFVPIRLGGRAPNRVDAAIARLVDGVAWRPEVCSIGRVVGTAPAKDGLVVRKHGRTTGLTEGTVTDRSYDALVGMDDADDGLEARFVDQLRIARRARHAAFGLGGDSGSLVVTAGLVPAAVGLYFAGPDDGSYGVANPFGAVLELLQVELAS